MDSEVGCLSIIDNCATKTDFGRRLLSSPELSRSLILLGCMVQVLEKYVVSAEKPWCQTEDISALTVAQILTELTTDDPTVLANWMLVNYAVQEDDRFYLNSGNFQEVVNRWQQAEAPIITECCQRQFENERQI